MKNKYIYITLSLLLFWGTSCSDFLDKEPPLSVNDGDIYTNPTRIENTLLGLYASMKNPAGTYALFGGKGYVAIDAKGDDVINVSSNNLELKVEYEMKVTNVEPSNTFYWEYTYLTINRVNTFLEGIEGAQEVLGAEAYNQFKAEALFVRAFCYYHLNNLYAKPYIIDANAKSVPLRIQAEGDSKNNELAAATVSEVYDQILQDLSDSNISALPSETNSYDAVTRASQAAANMLKMRTYMAQAKWSEAIKAGEAVTGYTLASDVSATFKAPFFTEESIFSLPMATNNRPNTQLSLPEFYNSSNDIFLVDTETGIMSKPNYSLEDDARKAFLKTENNRLLKYTDVSNKLDWVPIFRYAETLLGLSESYANIGGEANEAKAKELLTQVRRRSIKLEDDKLDIDALKGDALKEAISNERRLELLGEGVRGIDISRKGETYRKGTGIKLIEVKPTDNNYLWPIPYTETSTNPGVR